MRRAHDIPASFINLRIAIGETLNANRQRILQESNITELDLSKPTNRISVEQTLAVWISIVNQTGNQDVGLLSGGKIRLQTLGVLGYVMMNSKSMYKALEKLFDYQRLVVAIATASFEEVDSNMKINYEIEEEWQDSFRYTIDFVMASLATIIKNSTTEQIEPLELGFQFARPKNYESYEEFFKVNAIRFDVDTSYIMYKTKDLNAKVTGSDSEMFNHFHSMLNVAVQEHENVKKHSRETQRLIQKNLIANSPGIDEVAKELGMSVRSLQDNLKSENTSYQTLLNKVRKEYAIAKLKNQELNVTDVAFLSGFSDISVFSRNFKKWTGITPTQFQLQLSL